MIKIFIPFKYKIYYTHFNFYTQYYFLLQEAFRVNPTLYTKCLCKNKASIIAYFFLRPVDDPEETRDSGCLDDARGEGVDSVCGVTSVLACPDAGLVVISVDWALAGREAARSKPRIFSNATFSSFSASKARCSACWALSSTSLLRRKKYLNEYYSRN